MSLIEDAFNFAQERHDAVGQVRKYTGAPYWVHTAAVAARLEQLGLDDHTVAAAHLHDTVEDTRTSHEEIGWYFGRRVQWLVWEVTDQSRPEDGNRSVRKHIDRMHNALASEAGQNIKLSDLIDNTGSITAHDPHFSITYMAEKALLLPHLTLGHPRLREEAWALLHAWERSQVQSHLSGRPHHAR